MYKPKKLQIGDKVATVTSSWGGPATFPHRYEAGKRQLEEVFGVHVVEMPYAMKSADWLARNPQARADDLMQAFLDPSIKGIISTIGGDDSIRMLPYLDLEVIAQNPKIYLGYSDSTITHLACYKAGLMSYYGPSIMAGFGENGGLFPYMVQSVKQTLFSAESPIHLSQNQGGWTAELLNWADRENQTKKRTLTPSIPWKFLQGTGVHHGRLLGGCLEVFDWVRGGEFWPTAEQWEGAILFLETSEIGMSAEQLKYYLRVYASLGIFDRLAGLFFGRPGGNISPDLFGSYEDVLLQVIRDEAGCSELPIIAQMDFGHTDPMMILPYGIEAEIDCDNQQVLFVESAVHD